MGCYKSQGKLVLLSQKFGDIFQKVFINPVYSSDILFSESFLCYFLLLLLVLVIWFVIFSGQYNSNHCKGRYHF